MIRCANNHLLGDRRANAAEAYAGLYCLYCGETVATLEAEDGQIVWQSSSNPQRRHYLAAIHGNKQCVVSDVRLSGTDTTLLLGNATVPLPTHRLLLAFQNPEEKLELEGT